MFKKMIITMSIALMLTVSVKGTDVNAAKAKLDTSQVESGMVSVNHDLNKNIAVRIIKGKDQKDYRIDKTDLNKNDSFPLNYGDGEYTILLLGQSKGNRYKLIEQKKVTLNLGEKNDLFLQSNHMINWNEDMNAVKIARELTKDAKTDREKLTIIHDYVTQNVEYDYVKAATPQKSYVPIIDEMLLSRTGICYDYSTLTAAMLRSVGLPTKLLMGSNVQIPEYHAWNEVYLEDTKEWVTIDTTFNSSLIKGQAPVEMIKDNKEYTVERQY